MTSNPTLVFVHGSWHSPDCWRKVVSVLEPQGFKCVCVALPSTLGGTSTTFGEDVQSVRDAITVETTQGHDAVVVAHSYGGQVGNSSIKGFARPKSPTTTTTSSSPAPPASPTGHVTGIALIASGFTLTGVSFIDAMGGTPPPSWTANTASGFAELAADPRDLFYHDLPADEAAYWVGRLAPQGLRVLMEGGEDAYAGWEDVPAWYLATVQDRALPVQAQHLAVEAARTAGADVTMREVESSHSPMLSRPEETAQFLVDAAKYFVG